MFSSCCLSSSPDATACRSDIFSPFPSSIGTSPTPHSSRTLFLPPSATRTVPNLRIPIRHSITVSSNCRLVQLHLWCTLNCSRSITMTNRDSLNHTAWKWNDTIFFRCTETKSLQIVPCVSILVQLVFHFVLRNWKTTGQRSVICDAYPCLLFMQPRSNLFGIVLSPLVQPSPHDHWPCDQHLGWHLRNHIRSNRLGSSRIQMISCSVHWRV